MAEGTEVPRDQAERFPIWLAVLTVPVLGSMILLAAGTLAAHAAGPGVDPVGAIKELKDDYGMAAFGLVTLLALWLVIVWPLLKAQRAEAVQNQNLAKEQADSVNKTDQAVAELKVQIDRLREYLDTLDPQPER